MFRKENKRVGNIPKIGLVLLAVTVGLGSEFAETAEGAKISLEPGCYSFSENPVGWNDHNDPDRKALIDGNPRTSAEAVVATFRNSMDIQIDLGARYLVDRIVVHAHAGIDYRPGQITFYLGEDWNSYQEIARVENKTPPASDNKTVAVIKVSDIATTGRYVKLRLEKSGTYLQLCEFEIYGTPLGKKKEAKVAGEESKGAVLPKEDQDILQSYSAPFPETCSPPDWFQNGNTVRNGGFEEPLTCGWQTCGWEGNPSSVEVSILEGGGRDNSSVLQLCSKSRAAMGGVKTIFAVEPGKRYAFRTWVRIGDMDAVSRTGEGVSVCIGFLEGEETTYRYLSVGIENGSRDWREYRLDIDVPEQVRSAEIRLIMYRAKGTVFLDDVWFGDMSLGEPVDDGVVAVELSSAKANAIRSTKLEPMKNFAGLPSGQKKKLLDTFNPPPLKEVRSSNLGIIERGLAQWKSSYYLYPEVRQGVEERRMNLGQRIVQAREREPRGWGDTRSSRRGIQGEYDKDILVENITQGKKYRFSKSPTSYDEYTLHRRSGQFIFGAPQRGGDIIKLSYLYTYRSPWTKENKLSDSERWEVLLKDIEDLYCKNVTNMGESMIWQEYSDRLLTALREKGLTVTQRTSVASIHPLKVPFLNKTITTAEEQAELYRKYLPQMKDKIDMLALGGELDLQFAKSEVPIEKYIKDSRQLVKAIKEADPDIKMLSFCWVGNPLVLKNMLDGGMLELYEGLQNDYYGWSRTGHPENTSAGGQLRFNLTSEQSDLLEKLFGGYYSQYDASSFEKYVTALIELSRKYREDPYYFVGEWGYDYGIENAWTGSYLPRYRPTFPPPPTKDRPVYSKALKVDDIHSPLGNYNSAVMIARQALLYADLYKRLDLKGWAALATLHDSWHYSLCIMNGWNERKLQYYAYQTVNKLMYNPEELEQLSCETNLRDFKSLAYIRNGRKLMIILWSVYGEATVDVVLKDTGFRCPVQVDLFDYDNISPLKCYQKEGYLVLKDLSITQEPFIIRMWKE